VDGRRRIIGALVERGLRVTAIGMVATVRAETAGQSVSQRSTPVVWGTNPGGETGRVEEKKTSKPMAHSVEAFCQPQWSRTDLK
jgi:hypothetical protein